MKTHRENFKARSQAGLALWRAHSWTFSFSATVLFALYNGILGLCHASPWHGSICAYYLLLSALRGTLLRAEHKGGALIARRGVFYLTSAMLLLMNAALAAPTALMVLDRRPVQTGLIPAIASAAYMTYKISVACVKLKRTEGSLFIRELALLRLLDALVSILVLQNTLIIAVDGRITGEMLPLAAVSSAAILLLILALSVLWLVRGAREK